MAPPSERIGGKRRIDLELGPVGRAVATVGEHEHQHPHLGLGGDRGQADGDRRRPGRHADRERLDVVHPAVAREPQRQVARVIHDLEAHPCRVRESGREG